MLFNAIEMVVVALCCVIASVHCIHVFQTERYQMPVFSQWMRRNQDRFFRENIAVGFLASLLSGYLPIFLSLFISVESTRTNLSNWMMLIGFTVLALLLALRKRQTNNRKPFALTMRARRLFVVLTALFIVLLSGLRLIGIPPYIVYAAVPYVVWLSGRIMDPVEAKINMGFYEEARKKLASRKDLIKIGITGSYGKTLTKFILKELLSEKYKVLATPASFNTAMGISRVVNDQLEPNHQVFIAEMGAQHMGDIANLAKLVRPAYGMITSIGPQHLETFGSMANIMDGKNELISALPEKGVAFFASDCGYTDRLFGMCEREKYNAAVDESGDYYMRASGVTYSGKGAKFVLNCSDGTSVRCRTRLLGRYNIQNIALAAALCRRLGLTMEEISGGIARLQPFEKKLQLISGERMEIDDTLNDTQLGTAEALNVLAECPGRRIIVTAGIPDAGAKADEVNFAFGTQMQGCVDAVILVGEKQKVRPIAKGLLSTGFPKSALLLASDLADAKELVNEISGAGDTVLYECALPDA